MFYPDYTALLATWPSNSMSICITDLILLQKKALSMQNIIIFKNAGFCKLGHIHVIDILCIVTLSELF